MSTTHAISNALLGYHKAYSIVFPSKTYLDVTSLFQDAQPVIEELYQSQMNELNAFKWQIRLKAHFTKVIDESVKITSFLVTKMNSVMQGDIFDTNYLQLIEELEERIESFVERDTGLVVTGLEEVRVMFNKLTSSRIGCDTQRATLPFISRKACCNLRNTREHCFKAAVLCCLHYEEIKTTSYFKKDANTYFHKFAHLYDWSGVHFPTPIADIENFERNNNINVFVNGYEKNSGLFPLYRSKVKYDKEINLLLIKNRIDEGSSWKYQLHFLPILEIGMMLNSVQTKTKGYSPKNWCPRCLLPFASGSKLTRHREYYCMELKQSLKMPDDLQHPVKEFKEINKMLPKTMICFADFEAALEPICDMMSSNHTTKPLHRHVATSFCIQPVVYKCEHVCPEYKTPQLYRGPNAGSEFVNSLIQLAKQHRREMSEYRIPLSQCITEVERKALFNQENEICHICTKHIEPCSTLHVHKFCNSCKHIDHCNQCGVIRGSTHPNCNMQYKLSTDLVCYIHNTRRYDNHLIFQDLHKVLIDGKDKDIVVEVMAKNIESYLAITITDNLKTFKITILDSFSFLSTSIAQLTENLLDYGEDNFVSLRREFPNYNQFKLLLRKGVFPYTYIDSHLKYEQKHLPPPESFYNDIKKEHITDEDYRHALKVWKEFKIKTLGDYSDLYLKQDTLLLTDVFTSFQSFLKQSFNLDCAHFVSLPSFTYSAAFLKTKEKVELLTDIDMYLTFENGIRGGINGISKRLSIANRPDMINYDPSKPRVYIESVDITNSYGYCMTQKLPYSNFEWMSPSEFKHLDTDSILNLDLDSDIGLVFDCDLHYPDNLHSTHNALPLAPYHRSIQFAELPSHYQTCFKARGIKLETSSVRLVTDFHDKHRYVVHGKVLQLYLKLGIQLIQINAVVKFQQKAWLKDYVEQNTLLRNQAKNQFEKSVYKLLVNSLFGRLIMNCRKFQDVRVCTSPKHFNKLVSSTAFSSALALSPNVVLVLMSKKTIRLNQLVHCGFSVLDFSKIAMYRFYYEHLLYRFPAKSINLLAYDTDGIIFECIGFDFFKHIESDLEKIYDCSTLPKAHPLFNETNAKKLGFFKFESAQKGIITHFVGLKPKCYSLLFETGENIKKGKGIQKSVLDKHIKHEQYEECLLNGKIISETMHQIQSKHHELFTFLTSKICLSPFDIKRYVLEDGINSLAYGHVVIKTFKNKQL